MIDDLADPALAADEADQLEEEWLSRLPQGGSDSRGLVGVGSGSREEGSGERCS